MNGRPLGITIIAIILTVGAMFQIIAGTEALKITSFGLTSVTDANISGWGSIISGVLPSSPPLGCSRSRVGRGCWPSSCWY